jgi:hypothetical protein
MNKFVCKVYFTLDDLKVNETKESKIVEVKEKIEKSLFEEIIKNKVWFTINEQGEEVEIEGILKIKEDSGNVSNNEVFHNIRRVHENDVCTNQKNGETKIYKNGQWI